MADFKWKVRSTTPTTVLDTGLNSLANNAAVLSSAIAQESGSDFDLYADFELAVTFPTAPTADAAVELYIARLIDGTNYEDASATGPIIPKNGFVGAFLVRAVTTAQRMIVPQVPLPPRDFKVLLYNKSGQAFPASGSTLKALLYREQSA